MEKLTKRWTKQEIVVILVSYVFLLVFAIWYIMPLLFVITNSLKSVAAFNENVLAFPKMFEFANYKRALGLTYRNTNLIKMFFNSVIFCALFSVGEIFSSSMSAYVLSKYRFRGRKVILSVAMVVQIVPIFGSGGMSYLVLNTLGMIDNIWLIWISGASGFGYTFLIIYSYFKNVSWEYAEAAFIDGAGNFYVFLRIMLPMVTPALLTMWLSAVIGLWGDYLTPMLYLKNTPTLAAGIYNLKSLAAFTQGGTTTYFAALVISMVPLVILYLITQRGIFKVKLEGGIKG